MPPWPNLADLIDAPGGGARVGLVGVPLGTGSVTPGRCDLAPALLRNTLRRIGRYDVESGKEIQSRVADHGDVDIEGLPIEDATPRIRQVVAKSVAEHELTIVIGGNNAVTRPAVLGLEVPLEKVGLITPDAHFDMRDLDEGLGNGNPVRALLEDGLPGRNIAQIGLASFANSRKMHEDAVRAGNLVITMDEVRRHGVMAAVSQALQKLGHCEVIHLDCDIDVIDRSQFPGAPGGRPAGMSSLDFFAATRSLAAHPKVRTVDLTEWDPPLDPTDLSALTAARWLAECLAGFELR